MKIWSSYSHKRRATLLTLFILVAVWITYELITLNQSYTSFYSDTNIFQYHTNETFQEVDPMDMYVKSPFYDPRILRQNVIRMWALTTEYPPLVYCHVKFTNTKSVVVTKAKVETLSEIVPPFCKWVTAVAICWISSKEIPAFVAISKSYRPTNTSIWHKVKVPLYIPPLKPKYGVCLSPLFDMSDHHIDVHRTVEWFEMQKLLGIDQVVLYGTSNVSSVILKLLQSYEDSGFLIRHPWPLPMPTYTPNIYKLYPNDPEIQSTKLKGSQVHCVNFFAQRLIYMDCLYRYGDDFTYLGVFDIDEFITPMKLQTWAEMMKEIEIEVTSFWNRLWNYHPASFIFKEACFESEVTQSKYVKGEMYLSTKETKRLKDLRGQIGIMPHEKSISKPSEVIDVYVHWAGRVLPGHTRVSINPAIGRLNHYRNPAGACKMTYNTTTSDSMMSRFQKDLVKNMEGKLSELKLYKGHIP